MGANAQTSVPAFTTGQVLTAQQQTEINTGVPVFATTTTRDAAFGGTGEKVLAEGQLAYIEASDVVQYYNGSAWATLAPIPAALVFISATTIGTGVSSVTVSSAFSSTYENYLVTVAGADCSATARIRIALGASATGTAYYSLASTLGSGGTDQINRTNNGTYIEGGYWSTSDSTSITMVVYSPNVVRHTTVTGQSVGTDANGTETILANFGGGVEDTTQYTAFTLSPSAGTLTGGTIRVYGISNS